MTQNTSTPDTTLTVRINSTVKSAAQKTFRDLGLDLSTAINIFLRQVVQNRSLPFPIALPPSANTTDTTITSPDNPTTPENTPHTSSPDDLSGAARLLDDTKDAPFGEPFDFTR